MIEMVCLPDVHKMPRRTDDWKAIDKRIADAIEAAIAPLKPSGWRKALLLLREWGVLAVTVTAIISFMPASEPGRI